MQNSPDSPNRKPSIGHYIIGNNIGEGTFGKVKLGTHILTDEKVAVKILEKDKITDVADVERVAREIHILKQIKHTFAIQLYEVSLNIDYRNSEATLPHYGVCSWR